MTRTPLAPWRRWSAVVRTGPPPGSDSRTAAQKRFDEVQLQRHMKKAAAGELKSHRDRVQGFNSYLASMSEHYDLPKVSKGN